MSLEPHSQTTNMAAACCLRTDEGRPPVLFSVPGPAGTCPPAAVRSVNDDTSSSAASRPGPAAQLGWIAVMLHRCLASRPLVFSPGQPRESERLAARQ